MHMPGFARARKFVHTANKASAYTINDGLSRKTTAAFCETYRPRLHGLTTALDSMGQWRPKGMTFS